MLGSPPEVVCCDHAELAASLAASGQRVDALIVDCPYSERTHAGHDDASSAAIDARASIPYAAWTPADVAAFVALWRPLLSGWMVSITDHVLAPAWEAAMEDAGMCAFAPLACVEPGSRVRLMGDGPAQWSCWAVAARPRGPWLREWQAARKALDLPGALPGAYVAQGQGRRCRIPGGKPLALMRSLVRDYSMPGDLVCDSVCGAGTTLVAARMEGRRAIGCDRDPAHVDIARRWLAGLPPRSETQRGLFDDDTRYEGAAGQQERRT